MGQELDLRGLELERIIAIGNLETIILPLS